MFNSCFVYLVPEQVGGLAAGDELFYDQDDVVCKYLVELCLFFH